MRALITLVATWVALIVVASSSASDIGTTLVFDGPDSSDRINVTLMKVKPAAKSGNLFIEPDDGNRFYSVKLRIRNAGSDRYEDVVSSGMSVIDSKSQQWDNAFWAVPKPYLSSVNIRPGDSRVGWVTFEVPKKAKLRRLIFEPWFGFGDVGEWKLA